MYDIFDYVKIDQFFTEDECQSIISDLDKRGWINHTWTQKNESGDLELKDHNDFLIQFNENYNELILRGWQALSSEGQHRPGAENGSMLRGPARPVCTSP